MAYASFSVVFGEQPSAAKWNILGTNDASFNDGTGLNTGAVQQIQSTQTGAVATGTTTIPIDDTIPQNTEGDQYMTLAITPKSATNNLVIESTFYGASGGTNLNLTIALFQDSNANALAAGVFRDVTGSLMEVSLRHKMVAGTTSATTFKIRVGGDSAGTTTFNGVGGARFLGGVLTSNIFITEYKA